MTALVLALTVLGASSYLRLAANGIGCEPWPVCYGKEVTANAARASTEAHAARLTHRVAASAFALVALAAVVLGWRRWGGPARAAAVALIAVTATLALVGRYTPSTLPAITLANVLGGLTLAGCLGFLISAQRSVARYVPPHRHARALAVVLALLALQAASGTMISARSAGAACAIECSETWLPGAARLWNPLEPGSAVDLLRRTRAGSVIIRCIFCFNDSGVSRSSIELLYDLLILRLSIPSSIGTSESTSFGSGRTSP
ncbi:MAG: COX15/CtaA family protein [Burkholderiaceae bacterium]|nr:COX15/CtaA family protein [Burkholderiaceae bacterium]